MKNLIVAVVLSLSFILGGGTVAFAGSAANVAATDSTQCVFEYSVVTTCQSSNPDIVLNLHNDGDTSQCTFSLQVSWGDGSVQNFTVPGGPDGSEHLSNHRYSASSGTYQIQINGSVLSGFCWFSSASYQFTLVSGFANVVPIATAIMQGHTEPGWAGGPIPYSWGAGHKKTPGPTLGTCKGYRGNIHPCPANHTVGLDCSGFTRWVYYLAYDRDIFGPGNTSSQIKKLQLTNSPQPGDLVFFGTSTTNTDHVGIYIGTGKMINAYATGTYIRIDPIKSVKHFLGFYHYND